MAKEYILNDKGIYIDVSTTKLTLFKFVELTLY